MAAVTQTIPSYLGGVSKQTDHKKMPGQVRDCLNAYPDPTFGLRKRPGFKFIKGIHSSSNANSPDFANAKWFFIKRDNEEKYVGCILDSDTEATNPIKIWNASDGTACTVTYATNPNDTKDYLDTTRDNYDILTVQDTSIITNKTKTVTALPNPTYVSNRATVRVLFAKYSTRYSISIRIGSNTYTDVGLYQTINNENMTNNGYEEITNTTKKILTELKADLDAFSFPGTLTTTQLDTSLELSYVDANGVAETFEITATDNQGNSNILSFREQVLSVADLPDTSVNDRICKIINSSADVTEDTYWLKFVSSDPLSNRGEWVETKDPTVSPGMNRTTLPHELRNTATNTFHVQEVAWTERLVGDTITNSDPSFVGKKIQQTFYHNNRFGILTDDNVVLSQSADFYNFYFTSALTVTDGDPIDINCSSIRPAVLHGIIPTAQGLVLFSKNEQFILFSEDKILTPATASIRSIANYEMDSTIDPVDMGPYINFVSKTPSYTRIFAMQTRGSEENPQVQDIGNVVSEWVPDTVTSLISNSQNSLIALYGALDNTMYLYKTYSVGDRMQMAAWFNWDLPGNVQLASIDSDTMWSVLEYSGKYVIASSSLTQTPEETIIVNSDGQQVNPHMDLYGAVSSMTLAGAITSVDTVGAADANRPQGAYLIDTDDYTTDVTGTGAKFTINITANGGALVTITDAGRGYEINETITIADSKLGSGGGAALTFDVATISTGFTKCFLPTSYRDNESLTPVLAIAGTGTANFLGVTESGFTVTPDRPTGQTHATTAPFFEAQGKDLTGLSTGDVIIGYKYNYNIELPKTYFNMGGDRNQYDYTAALTVARMKFALGLSSVASFKVKSKRYRGDFYEATGDGSTTAVSIPFLLKEENGIKVTLDGARQPSTAYTVTSTATQSTVTFNTAPAGQTTTANKVTPAKKIEITTDTWYDVQSSSDAGQYLADDVPLLEENVFTIPIHQRSDNFSVRVFSDSPFPVSLTSMMWEGQYSPSFYKRT